jgi:LPXTG-motif cell wall-anchored protein
MYQKAGAAFAAGTTGGLAWTGANVVWLMLAGFALLAAGAALVRIAPRWRKRRS